MIKTQMRQSDVLARFGGEEFAVLLVQTDQNLATEIAERIRHQIDSHKITLGNNTNLSVTISIGCTTLDNHDESLIASDASQQTC